MVPTRSFFLELCENQMKRIKTILVLLGILILTISILYLFETKEERWMQWRDGRYVELDQKPLDHSKIGLEQFHEGKLKNFKQIKSPNCHTIYFTDDGTPITWYYITQRASIEVYTSSGIHPLEKVPLKPISEFIIQKYICTEYHPRFTGYY